jgi:hypothetical protein
MQPYHDNHLLDEMATRWAHNNEILTQLALSDQAEASNDPEPSETASDPQTS